MKDIVPAICLSVASVLALGCVYSIVKCGTDISVISQAILCGINIFVVVVSWRNQ